MSPVIVPLILSGGQSKRLWPFTRLSAQTVPAADGTNQLFQQTLERVSSRNYAPPVVITNMDYRFIVGEKAADSGIELAAVLLEPIARNTALAIAASATYIQQRFGPDALIHVLPSDHRVTTNEGYWLAIQQAAAAATAGQLVTFGIEPTHPGTAFGYVKSDAALEPVRVP